MRITVVSPAQITDNSPQSQGKPYFTAQIELPASELAKLGRDGKDREDYLERQKDAQFAVPEDALVEAVKKVLARYQRQ